MQTLFQRQIRLWIIVILLCSSWSSEVLWDWMFWTTYHVKVIISFFFISYDKELQISTAAFIVDLIILALYLFFISTWFLLSIATKTSHITLKENKLTPLTRYLTYCKTRYVSIFPLYVKAFGLSKIEQNEKEKLYLNILGFHIFDEEKLLQDKRIKVDRRQMKSSRTWT